jgi:drug/metabolite transporter (DMT)-like permease
MEPWFLFALVSAVFAGLYSFTTRVSAHFQHHSAHVYLYSCISAATLSGIAAIFSQPDFSRIELIFFIALVDALAYMVASMMRVDALKVIDSTLFFPIYKVSGSIVAVIIGILLFSETLTVIQSLGISVGLLAPLLLINRTERLRQRNLSKGLFFTSIGVTGALVATVMGKLISVLELDISLYIFFAFSLSIPIAAYLYKRTNSTTHKVRHVEWVGLLGGLFMFANLFFFMRALAGNLAMTYLINSFSTVFVVGLSVLVFREHVNWKKAAALVVTIISLMMLR